MKSTGPEWSEPTLWPKDTPASHSATPAVEQENTILDTFGPCSPIAFAWYDPDTHCWRTLQATLVSDSDLFCQTWPRSGMTQDGIAYQLPPSAPRTFAIAYSLSQHAKTWHTPTKTANQDAPSMEAKQKIGPNSDGLWPTPTTGDHATRYAQGGMPLGMAARIWPTPVASDWKRQQVANNRPNSISGAVWREEGRPGRLNPTWVEWLMGFPEGWTDLEASETP